MAGSYLPLIGGDNLVSVIASGGVAMVPGTINGVAVAGRAGKVKTALLVALEDAAVSAVPATTSALLFSVTVECPPNFTTPSAEGLDGFDYAGLLPVVRAECVAKDFTLVSPAWPIDMTALIAAQATLPPNLTQITGRLTAMGAPDTTHPYGTLTYAFSGSATTAAVTAALIALSIDFGASAAN